jgi:hypothetical protein
VLSRRQYNTFLVRASVTIRDCQHGAVNYGQSLAQGRDHHILALDLIVLNRCHISLEVRVGVRERVAEVDSVLIELELVVPAETVEVIGVAVVLSHRVLVIPDVAAVPVPAYALLFGLLLGVDCHFHSVVEHAIGLVVVGDVEAHSVTCSCVRHAEKEPLSVTLGVDVILHKAVVFVVADLLRQEQISRLESGLKH